MTATGPLGMQMAVEDSDGDMGAVLGMMVERMSRKELGWE